MTKISLPRLMRRNLLGGIALGTLAFAGTVTQAQARSGQAAYHLHTNQMVTAARFEPRGSVLRVTNPENGNTVTVLVNDRGPFNGNRYLDLSTGAFRKLYGGLGRGVGPMTYEVISRPALSSRNGNASQRSRKYSRKKKYRRSYRNRR